MVSEDGDQLRLRHSFWWVKFNWIKEILLVHLSTLNLTIGQVKFNPTLCSSNSYEFCTSQPIQGNHTAIISYHCSSQHSLGVIFTQCQPKKYKVSVFELASSKTTHLSIWCQMQCKTWIWATHQGRCQSRRNTPSKGGQGKKATPADDAQVEDQQVKPTNNTAQVEEADTIQPSTSGTQSNDQMAQILLMMQKTFDEQLKFQREQQKHQDSQLPPLEKIPEIDWTHNDGLHSCFTIWKEQWNAIFKSDYLFALDQVKVHRL